MSRKRRGPREGFNPNVGSDQRAVDQVMDELKGIVQKSVEIVEAHSRRAFAHNLRPNGNIGVAMLLSVAEAHEYVAMGLRHTVEEWRKEQIERSTIMDKERTIDASAKAAADAAFPGVEDIEEEKGV